jgi:hypothetical protein
MTQSAPDRVEAAVGLGKRGKCHFSLTDAFTALAWRLRERAMVTLRWVSEALDLWPYPQVTQAVSRMRRKPGRKPERLKRELLQTLTLL